ncbi:3002_t:CDS:2 [Funneliformis geosporum]|uniref:3002_t:CDS:1 n=1 Tax=Funneliformis geosporum TaxID=1117311 RepID=A0A9W4SNG3_9GLOM|nr:3002_t:CDS:2 [Funneliformis geosporum]
MSLIKISIILSFLFISVFSQTPSQQPEDLGAVIQPYQTANVPPNNGTWRICGKTKTKSVSYSVRVVPDSTLITPGFGIESKGIPVGKTPITPLTGSGILTFVASSDSAIDISNHSTFYRYIPSLSCETATIKCDQDTGKVLIESFDIYCLVVKNIFTNPQKINVAFSDSDTVFKNGGFTSPNKSGGNTKEFVPDKSGANNSGSNAAGKNTYYSGLIGDHDL